jgi:phosphonate transport system permease protein
MEPKRAISSATDSVTGGLDPRGYFLRRTLAFVAVFGAVAIAALGSAIITEFDGFKAFTAVPKVIVWMTRNLVPDARALGKLPNILGKLLDTVLVSVMATVTAGIGAFVASILAARATRPHPLAALAVRFAASILRNIPVVAWAMIFLFSFGQSMLTGFLAIFFETFGFLTRAFIETVDEASSDQVEALRSTGAGWWHTIVQAVLPSVLPRGLSWLLYMVETNIRSATLVGILTGTGIGFAFNLYYKSLDYGPAALVVVSVVLVVVLLEFVSNAVRRSML